jgi:ABC-2 type transport system ATP-binding protein
LTREDETTVLLTTHYLDEADRLADVVAIVDRGRVRVEGSPDALKAELRGDTITVGLATAPDPAVSVARVGSVAGVFDVSLDGGTLRARAEAGARAVPLILAALDESGAEVATATVARPTLDDVYLRHVGRSFEAVA